MFRILLDRIEICNASMETIMHSVLSSSKDTGHARSVELLRQRHHCPPPTDRGASLVIGSCHARPLQGEAWDFSPDLSSMYFTHLADAPHVQKHQPNRICHSGNSLHQFQKRLREKQAATGLSQREAMHSKLLTHQEALAYVHSPAQEPHQRGPPNTIA